MTEEAVTEAVEPTEAQAEADFESGFKAQDDKSSTETKPEQKAETKPVEEKAQEAAQPEAKAVEEKKEALIAGMTEADWNAAVAKSTGPIAEELRGEIRKTFGKIGEITTTIKQLQAALAAGKSSGRKITAEQLKRVSEELPGLGEALAADLAAIFDSPAAAEAKEAAEAKGQTFDPEKFFAERVGPALEQFKVRANEEAQTDLLEFMHPGYVETLKTPEFKGWLQTLSPERQKEVVESPRAIVAGKAISEFKEWQAKAQKDKDRNKTRLEGAITPKGAAQPGGPTPKDEETLFNQGFNEAGKKYAR